MKAQGIISHCLESVSYQNYDNFKCNSKLSNSIYLLNLFLNSCSVSFKNHHSAVAQEKRVTQLRAEIIAPDSKICRELNTAMSTVVSTAHVINFCLPKRK